MADREAERRFERIYEAYHRQVYAYFRRRTDPSAAQECAAGTFLLAWRRFDKVPDGEGTLPWLYAAARRVLANHYRASRRLGRLLARLSGLATPDPPRPETVVLQREADQQVLAALDRLHSTDRELLRLAVWEEIPREQLAEMLACSPHAVSQRLHRATERLARHLPEAGHRRGEAAPQDTQRGTAT